MRPPAPASAAALLAVAASALAGCTGWGGGTKAPERPNVLLVVADDLGYSDLGAYGSEIHTPNLDALADAGLLATDFYVSPRGEPTRAMLLTGADNHAAGFGSLPRLLTKEQRGKPGYEGHLSDRVVTVPTLLREAGYLTAVAGRWALGAEPGSRPDDRGFERSFVLLEAAASHFADMRSAVPGHERARYTRDGQAVETLPPDYYSTRDFTDFAIEAVDASHAAGRPFFVYLSYQSVHGPLGVPDDWRDRCKGRYDEGYDATRRARLLRMKSRGLVHDETRPYPGIPTVPSWDELDDEQKAGQIRKMELYAAMVENVDFHLGRLIEHLDAIGERQNTLVVFLSDSGPEAADRGPSGMDERDRDWFAQQFPVRGMEEWGRPGTFVEVGAAWAQVSSVPFRLFKGTQAEGGIRSPLVVSGAGVRARWRATGTLLHVTDLAPTFLELAGVEFPSEYRGRALAPLAGRSLVPLFAGARRGPRTSRDSLAFAFAGDRALRKGRWKLVWMGPPFGVGNWRLYRIDLDPSELYDQAKKREEIRDELGALWDAYARSNGVVLPEGPVPSILEVESE